MTAGAMRLSQIRTRTMGVKWTPLLVVLAGAILTYVWRVQDLLPGLSKFSLPTLLSVVAPVVFILSPARHQFGRTFRDPVMKVGAAILVLMVLAVPTSLYPGYSLSFILKDFLRTFLLMAFIACAIRGPSDILRLMFVALGGALLYSWVILLTVHVGADGRLGDLIYYDANDLALLLVCSIPLTIVLFRQGGKVARVLAVGGMGLLLLTLVKTGSRGGFLGLLACGTYVLFGFTTISKRARFGSLAVIVVLMLGIGSDSYWKMMGTLIHPTEDYNWSGKAEEGRMEVWKRGIGYMMTHPLLGVGPRAFFQAEGTISPLAAQQAEGVGVKWSEAHNSFVEIGAELGIPGLLLFIALLWVAFRSLRRSTRIGRQMGPPGLQVAEISQALTGSLVAFCVSGFFLSQAYSAFLYTILGLVAGLAMSLRRVAAAHAVAPEPTAAPNLRQIPGWRASAAWRQSLSRT